MEFEIHPLDPIGAEVRGIALRSGISDATLDRLRRAVVECGFVVLRGQHLAPSEHVALGRRFGEIEQGSFNDESPDPDLTLIANRGTDGRIFADDDVRMRLVAINEGWHTDSSFRPIPASFSLFAAVVVPPEGGDTFFASLRRAWESLDAGEREALRGLVGVHDYAAAFERFGSRIEGNPIFDLPPVRHPLVRRHPESGVTALYTSEHVFGIEGMPNEQARALLARLLAQTTAPENVYRHRWCEGDFMIWDNRSMLHRAQGFDARFARVMHHVRIAGTEAVIAA